MIDGIQTANKASLTVSGVLAAVIYGGIIEEILLRLFFMTLIALAVWKLFFRKHGKENIPQTVFVIANVIAAIVFAAGHLPATLSAFGELTPLILFRCFLLNGSFGLFFGEIYRKYGIIYSMISHAAFHIICKLIWLIFI
ncbi:MAG: CPBP family intramembrane metalloprotease [Clostridia bacterium]|nr:CPBP family intramembrane metalloprotease [Clostridia bacterium]